MAYSHITTSDPIFIRNVWSALRGSSTSQAWLAKRGWNADSALRHMDQQPCDDCKQAGKIRAGEHITMHLTASGGLLYACKMHAKRYI